MKFKLLTLTIGLFLLASCTKEHSPYSEFKKANYNKIKKESIAVDLNEDYYMIIDNGYKLSAPVYSIQKNNEAEQIISGTPMIKTESHGWNGKKELKFEIVRVHIYFDPNIYSGGDQLTVYASHGSVKESLLFTIN